MKKHVLPVLVGIMLIALPLMVFAMDTAMKDVRWLTDSEMETLDGQAGVDITFYGGNTTVTQSIEGVAWGDGNGLAPAGAAAHFRMESYSGTGFPFTVTINISSGETLSLDVDDALGICIRPPRIEQTIDLTLADGITIITTAGEVPAAWFDNITTQELGTVSWSGLSVAIDTDPATMICIDSH